MVEIPQLIRALRQEQQLTQRALAQRSGTTQQYIHRLEKGKTKLRLSVLKRIVEGGLGRHLDISIK